MVILCDLLDHPSALWEVQKIISSPQTLNQGKRFETQQDFWRGGDAECACAWLSLAICLLGYCLSAQMRCNHFWLETDSRRGCNLLPQPSLSPIWVEYGRRCLHLMAKRICNNRKLSCPRKTIFLRSSGCHDAGEGRFEGTWAFLQGFSNSAYRKGAIRELQTLSTSAQISFSYLWGIRDQFSASAFLLFQFSTLHDQQYSVRGRW